MAVFDVPPYRLHFKGSRGFHCMYYSLETWQQFMADLLVAARAADVTLLFKTKRTSHRFHHPRFERRFEALRHDRHVVCLDPGIAPTRIFERATAVVSMPFTALGRFARLLNVLSIYYDPGGGVAHYTNIAADVPILTDATALADWFRDCSQGITPNTRAAP